MRYLVVHRSSVKFLVLHLGLGFLRYVEIPYYQFVLFPDVVANVEKKSVFGGTSLNDGQFLPELFK